MKKKIESVKELRERFKTIVRKPIAPEKAAEINRITDRDEEQARKEKREKGRKIARAPEADL